jgi:uncharacterized protein
MEQRVSVITLGVEDVSRSRAFYESMGWTLGFTDGDIVMFQAGGSIVSLWSRDKLAADSNVVDSGGWGGCTLGHAVKSADAVDRVVARAEAAGCTVTRPAGPMGFGYSGVFADPDGHTWEVAFIEAVTIGDDGGIRLPS